MNSGSCSSGFRRILTQVVLNPSITLPRMNSGFDWHAIFEALNQIKQELDEHFPYPVIEVDGAEADDVIASLVFWSQENDLIQFGLDFESQPVLILSGDHDFAQLQRFKVFTIILFRCTVIMPV